MGAPENYYFPGPIQTIRFPRVKNTNRFWVNSCSNAIRLLLKSYNLPPHVKVAVPVFVCESLTKAVIQEQFEPCYFDVKKDSYWTNYDLDRISIKQCSIVILVHLYGFLHPDTNTIEEYCKRGKIFLIHDMAQCYGANESLLSYGSIVYSFGPGKSTSAAGGGLIKEIDNAFYKSQIKEPSFWVNYKAIGFLKSRIDGYRFSVGERIAQKFLNKIPMSDSIQSMSAVQKDAAEYVMSSVSKIGEERLKRYRILSGIVTTGHSLLVAYDDNKGLYFKIVLYVKANVNGFKEYLTKNKVPFYSLYDSIKDMVNLKSDFPNFRNNTPGFIELSIEASVPIDEIERIGEILNKYN